MRMFCLSESNVYNVAEVSRMFLLVGLTVAALYHLVLGVNSNHCQMLKVNNKVTKQSLEFVLK